MQKDRVNIYGWTDEHDAELKAVFNMLTARGVRGIERDDKPNKSAILLYLLEQAAKEARR